MIDLGACTLCGQPAMAVFATGVVTEVQAQYASCPFHVDTLIARMQDQLHDVMTEQEGVLIDWWAEVNPQPEPEVEQAEIAELRSADDEDTTPADSESIEPSPTELIIE